MDHERVRAELAERRVKGSVLKRLGASRSVLSKLLGRGSQVRSFFEEVFAAEGFASHQLMQLKRGEIGALFLEQSDADRSRLIAALLPQVSASAEVAWEIMKRRPYQESPTRKPFRCPFSPHTMADVRGRWLLNTTLHIGEYDADIRWVAERAAHLGGWSAPKDLGWLLAGAIDGGDAVGNDVFEILKASAVGEHETGQMGHHVVQAMLSCGRPEAWAFVERLLLSAARQEGLRQAILECVDEAHPEAFRRMLRLVRDENLTRFSSVVRAADTWFGFAWDGTSSIKIDEILDRVLRFLDDPAARQAALAEPDAETVYLALWCTAFEDVDAAIGPASLLLTSESVEVRFVATHFLVQALWSTALPPLVDMLDDKDLRVAARALDAFILDVTAQVDGELLFRSLEQLIGRLTTRSKTLDPLVWPWWSRKIEKPVIAGAMWTNSAPISADRMLRYVGDLDPFQRAAFIRRIAGLPTRWDPRPQPIEKKVIADAARAVILDLLGDASADVRSAAFEAMSTQTLRPDETERLIALLGRKPGDLRSASLARLRALTDPELLATADALIADGSELRRLAGLELLRDAVESKRAVAEARVRIERYAAQHSALSDQETAHVSGALEERTEVAGTSDALGLIDPALLKSWPAPKAPKFELHSRAAREAVCALADLVLEHQQTEIQAPSGETGLLIASFPLWLGPRKVEDPVAHEAALPLVDVWKRWTRERPTETRDADGLEFLRALMTDHSTANWSTASAQKLAGLGQWRHGERLLRTLLEWCAVWDPPAVGAADFLLDGLERVFASLGASDYRGIAEHARETSNWMFHAARGGDELPFLEKMVQAEEWLRRFRWWRELHPNAVQVEHAARLYGLLRAFEARSEGGAVWIQLDDFLGAYRAGVADEVEFIDLLVGRWSHKRRSSLLRDVSSRKPPRALLEHPELLEVVDRCRRRIVEVETRRGDRQTAVSSLTLDLRWTGGLDTLSLALPALGKSHFTRSFGWSGSGASRQDTLSHLVLRSTPRADDSPEKFAAWAKSARLSETRLIELAVYAPQWAAHVNYVVGWTGLESAVWWVQAHTKDDRSWQLQDLKEIWAAEVSERTSLSAADLIEGAVDVGWFHDVHAALGTERWKTLDKVAKYAAGNAGHTRAQLFGRAMAGTVERTELLQRIESSRHQDSVRAIGLLPLADEAPGRDDLLERYTILQEFRRQSRKFGSQRQQSEGRAVTIALTNLARTAGYRDPQRLQWAMEREAVADLAQGPLVHDHGDVKLELLVEPDGAPSLRITKAGKTLKSLPAALKKDPTAADLRARLQELKRQASRVRGALEEAMCRGDRFAPAELRTLLEHPILAPALSRLVFAGDEIAGYLGDNAFTLRDSAGTTHVIGTEEALRIAHPNDLFQRGDWSAWQRECFRAERVQPFKQVFREVYPCTESEREAKRSRRYAGHQVNPRQALALLGGRGWVARPEEGVNRTFHEDGLTARLGFQESFYTPADIEGLTLEEVVFTHKGDWNELELGQIPARIFSEAMRDLDLVVSVAHQGGVDPEATASTIEMRARLIEETCELLGIENVELKPNHVIVKGELGTYSIHLGSAGVLLMPGTALLVVAVHSQHRGRLFLPFADDDPRTAEVLSKVLLFARDEEIRDPNILARIRAAESGPPS